MCSDATRSACRASGPSAALPASLAPADGMRHQAPVEAITLMPMFFCCSPRSTRLRRTRGSHHVPARKTSALATSSPFFNPAHEAAISAETASSTALRITALETGCR